eukprot:1182727-Prorocentrum_minimum.AAC.2
MPEVYNPMYPTSSRLKLGGALTLFLFFYLEGPLGGLRSVALTRMIMGEAGECNTWHVFRSGQSCAT